MARRREPSVHESERTLAVLERRHGATMLGARIRALRRLRDPLRPREEIAREVGVSVATVDRWWRIYRSRGLEGLLEEKPRGGSRPSRVTEHDIAELKTLVARRRLAAASDVRRWLAARGAAFSPSGVRQLLEREGIVLSGPRSSRHADAPEGPDATEAWLAFLDAMPTGCDTAESIGALRDAIGRLLPDVDRVLISVDTACDLVAPHSYRPDVAVVHDLRSRSGAQDGLLVARESDRSPAELLLDSFARQGYPLDAYRPPHHRDILQSGAAYLGTIFLWRERGKPAISPATLAFVDRLLPFLSYALGNIVARHHYLLPAARMFNDALEQMSAAARLTVQERRVVTYRLYGYRYKAISQELGISVDAVKKHLGAVHRKTRTSGHAELFAKYFTARLLAGAGRPAA